MATASGNTGPMTFEDVVVALGDTDPFSTNAGAIQKLIGRGSNATAQKHLDTIRAAARAPVEVAPGAVPTAPAEAVAAMWGAAYAAAQVLTLGRLETVTAQREQLLGQVAQLSQDLGSALADRDADQVTISEKDAQLAQVQAEREMLTQTMNAKQAAADQVAQAANQDLEGLKQALERLKTESAATVAMMERDARIAAQTMQMTIDALNSQIHQRDLLLSQVHAAPAPK